MTEPGGWWLWLFPLTYAVHIAEEGLAGERFYRWIRRVPLARALGVQISGPVFFTLNAILLVVMAAAVLAAPSPGSAWVTPALGALVAANGLGHLAGSLATRSYSPGLVSGMILWVPLGVFALGQSHRRLPPGVFWAGAGGGLAALAAVGALAALVGPIQRGLGPGRS